MAALASLSPYGVTAQQAAREALLAQMLADPTDQQAMLAFARIATEDRDFEAAVATLERLLDADPAHLEARLALARAYFALGALDPAQYHLGIYMDRGDLTEAERWAGERLAQSAERRAGPVTWTGSVQMGLAFRADEGDAGLAYGADIFVSHDMRGAVTHRWDSDLRLRGYYLPEDDTETKARLVLRTGPSFAVDGTALGPRLRPYLALETVVDDDRADEGTALSAGLGYDNPLSRNFGVFASIEAGRLWRDQGDDADRQRGILGVTWRPVPDLDVRLSGRQTREDTGSDDLTRTGARLDVTWRFDAGLGGSARLWELGAFGQGDTESFSGPREDDLTAYGARLRGYWAQDWFGEVGVSRLDRDSNNDRLDDSETLIALTLGRSF